jgi:alpha-beta hydrolase superfamily lysophospholipase
MVMTTMTTMMTITTIASPATIESTGAAVLVPHLARRGFDVIVFDEQSCAICKHADAHAFECHRCADVRAFVLGQGRRDDGANGVVVGDSSGDLHRGGRGTNDGNSDADDILC